MEDKSKLTKVEEKVIGKVSFNVYITYFKSWGSLIVLLLIGFFYMLNEGMQVFISFWMEMWTADSSDTPNQTSTYYIVLYLVFTLVGLIITILSNLSLRIRGLISAKVKK